MCSVCLLALAQHIDVDGLADRRVGHDARQLRGSSATGLPSKPVTRSPFCMPAFAAGPSARHIRHQRALGGGQAHAFGDLLRHRLDAHADPAAPRHAELAQLRHHFARQIGGNGEADADAAAARARRSPN